MKNYLVENGYEVNLNNLKSKIMPFEEYKLAHENLVIPCHDVFINYNGGILLVNRDNFPAKDELWSIGGRVMRGLSTEDSLRNKTKEECSLELDEINFLGLCRTYFTTDPFGHGHGADTLNLIYYAKGKGEVNLDDLHSQPRIITSEIYTPKFRDQLHPYIRDHMDIVINFLE